ncbi:MAG: hypothetical protein OSA98_25860 [Rubripirellula sp.]|nr:hypothetical protein [Rubripirellula sp.]
MESEREGPELTEQVSELARGRLVDTSTNVAQRMKTRPRSTFLLLLFKDDHAGERERFSNNLA